VVKWRSIWVYLLAGGLALAVTAGLLIYFSQGRQSSLATGSSSAAGPLRLAVVGQPASGFSLPDQFGRPYTLAPGDGKNHLLVFYMGNF
jgi:hypothetical protein